MNCEGRCEELLAIVLGQLANETNPERMVPRSSNQYRATVHLSYQEIAQSALNRILQFVPGS